MQFRVVQKLPITDEQALADCERAILTAVQRQVMLGSDERQNLEALTSVRNSLRFTIKQTDNVSERRANAAE